MSANNNCVEHVTEFVPVTVQTLDRALKIMERFELERRAVAVVFDPYFFCKNLSMQMIKSRYKPIFGDIRDDQVLIRTTMSKLLESLEEVKDIQTLNQAYIVGEIGLNNAEINRRAAAKGMFCCPMTMGCVVNNLKRGIFLMSDNVLSGNYKPANHIEPNNIQANCEKSKRPSPESSSSNIKDIKPPKKITQPVVVNKTKPVPEAKTNGAKVKQPKRNRIAATLNGAEAAASQAVDTKVKQIKPAENKSKPQLAENKSKTQPAENKSKSQPAENKSKSQQAENKSKSQPAKVKSKPQPANKPQPTNKPVEKEVIDKNLWDILTKSGNTVIRVNNLPAKLTIQALNLMLGTYTLKSTQIVAARSPNSNNANNRNGNSNQVELMDIRVILYHVNEDIQRILSKKACKTCYDTVLDIEITNFKELKLFLLSRKKDLIELSTDIGLPVNSIGYSKQTTKQAA